MPVSKSFISLDILASRCEQKQNFPSHSANQGAYFKQMLKNVKIDPLNLPSIIVLDQSQCLSTAWYELGIKLALYTKLSAIIIISNAPCQFPTNKVNRDAGRKLEVTPTVFYPPFRQGNIFEMNIGSQVA